MRCDHCHEREAVIHLTQLAEDQAVQVHLCEKCAAEKGVEPTPPGVLKSPLGGFLAQLSPAGLVEGPDAGLRCPRCGAGLADFREAGRLGCAECWEVFASTAVIRCTVSSRLRGVLIAALGELVQGGIA